MKAVKPISIILFSILVAITACDKSNVDGTENFIIENISTDNYPRVDGSTSTEPLQAIIACKLLDVDYSWIYMSFYMKYPYGVMAAADENTEVRRFISERSYHSGTHSAFVNLISDSTDLILTARSSSEDELHIADSLGVTLIETPVALDAFIFLVNKHNSVNELTTKEIQNIYTGKITNWNEVGGSDELIKPYMRERNSGSQELMELLVMKNLEMLDLPEMIFNGMLGLVNVIEDDNAGLGYSVNYYTQYMIRSEDVKRISVDGVYPDSKGLRSRNYPYTEPVYAVIRSDLDINSNAYKLYQLLTTESGQEVIKESGYIPYY